jgi:hypothetical protein
MKSNQRGLLDDGLLAFAITDVGRELFNSDGRGPILALIQHLALAAGDSDTLNQLADDIVTRRATSKNYRDEDYTTPTREELLVGAVDYLKMDRVLEDAVSDADSDRLLDEFGETHPNW